MKLAFSAQLSSIFAESASHFAVTCIGKVREVLGNEAKVDLTIFEMQQQYSTI